MMVVLSQMNYKKVNRKSPVPNGQNQLFYLPLLTDIITLRLKTNPSDQFSRKDLLCGNCTGMIKTPTGVF